MMYLGRIIIRESDSNIFNEEYAPLNVVNESSFHFEYSNIRIPYFLFVTNNIV